MRDPTTINTSDPFSLTLLSDIVDEVELLLKCARRGEAIERFGDYFLDALSLGETDSWVLKLEELARELFPREAEFLLQQWRLAFVKNAEIE